MTRVATLLEKIHARNASRPRDGILKCEFVLFLHHFIEKVVLIFRFKEARLIYLIQLKGVADRIFCGILMLEIRVSTTLFSGECVAEFPV